MKLFLQKHLRAAPKNFSRGAVDFSGMKNRGEPELAPAFPGNSYGEKPCLYFAVLRRRRTIAATPEMPVPSRIIVAGSGTVVCDAPVIWPVTETVWPGSIEMSLTLKLKEPVPQVVWPAEGGCASGFGSQFVSLKVKVTGVLSKSTKTPPVLSLRTVPVMVAVNVAVFEPLMPCGAVNVTWSVKGVL